MCSEDERCLRVGNHYPTRHRFTPTKAEARAARTAQATAHITIESTVQIGRFRVESGEAVRVKQGRGKSKVLGVFQRIEHNARSGKTHVVVLGGKVGKLCREMYVTADDLIYLRPDSADARTARTFVELSSARPRKKAG